MCRELAKGKVVESRKSRYQKWNGFIGNLNSTYSNPSLYKDRLPGWRIH